MTARRSSSSRHSLGLNVRPKKAHTATWRNDGENAQSPTHPDTPRVAAVLQMWGPSTCSANCLKQQLWFFLSPARQQGQLSETYHRLHLFLAKAHISQLAAVLQLEVNQGLQEGLEVLKQQKALADALSQTRGDEVQGLRLQVASLTGQLTEAQDRVQQAEVIRRKLHNTILVCPATSHLPSWATLPAL